VYPITPFQQNIVLIHPDPETPDTPSPVTFSFGADGKATAITIERLNSSGLGTLTRAQ
jgi:hypothetical protein